MMTDGNYTYSGEHCNVQNCRLCCTPQTNRTLFINYTSMRKKLIKKLTQNLAE